MGSEEFCRQLVSMGIKVDKYSTFLSERNEHEYPLILDTLRITGSKDPADLNFLVAAMSEVSMGRPCPTYPPTPSSDVNTTPASIKTMVIPDGGYSGASIKSMVIPDGAECYLCLGEGPDDEGKPLVRDCACRNSAGFAHLSCLIKYAEQKSKDAAEMDTNCKQQYHNILYLDLTSAFVSFTERVYGNGNSLWDKMRAMHSLLCKSASCLEPN